MWLLYMTFVIIIWNLNIVISLENILVEEEKEYGKPNIVLIVADDMGWGDVGANWPPTLDTPNIDKLAKLGLRFTDFHVGASVCTPSRAAILTGRLGLRTGVVKNFNVDSVGGIPENETTIAEILKDSGYKTAILGKWHLGTTAGHHPLDKGFEHYFGVPYSVDMGCADFPGENLPECPPCAHENSIYAQSSNSLQCPFDDFALPLYNDRKIFSQPLDLRNLANQYANFAREFILNSSSTPYFLYAALSHIHVPLAHADHFTNVTGRGVFADTLRELDWLVGEIMSAVRAGSRSDNTLVWFITDNGPWEVKCHLSGSAGPFLGLWQRNIHRGGGGSSSKTTIWEGGHRVPSILYWASQVKPNSISNALVSSLDFLPTFAALANTTLLIDRVYDGFNIENVILGRSNTAHEVLFHPNCNSAALDGKIGAVRIAMHKVVYYTGGTPDCSGKSGPLRHYEEHPLIFNLENDPAESEPLKKTDKEYKYYLRESTKALNWLHKSISHDKISTVDYTEKYSARPCCDRRVANCRCPWDN